MTGCTAIDIEGSIMSALESLTVISGGAVKTLRTFGSGLDNPEEIRQWATGGFPAVFVSITGADYSDIGYPSVKENIRVDIYCCAQSLRDNKDNARLGSYTIMRSILEALHDANLNVNAMPPQAIGWKKLTAIDAISILRVNFIVGNILRK